MDILRWTTPPAFAARDQFEFGDALGAERDFDDTVAILIRGRHEHAHGFPERRFDLGPMHELADMRRADLLFAFGDHHEIDRQLCAGAAQCVQCGEECGLRPLLIDRTAADHDFADTRLVDEARLQRRRRPLRGVEVLYVVHEVQADGFFRTGIERREHAGLAVGRENRDFLKPGLARELGHVFGAGRVVHIHARDRRQCDPVLQAFDVLVVVLGDFLSDRSAIGSNGKSRKHAREQCGGCNGAEARSAATLHEFLQVGLLAIRPRRSAPG